MSETATQDPAADDPVGGDPAENQGVESLTTAPRETVPVARAGSGAAGGGAVTLPRLGPFGMLRWAWRQLTSMRIALILLFMLSLAAIPGSLIPQRNEATDPAKVADFLARHRTLGPILDKLQFFEVYKSAWFASIYLLLFISLIGCIVPRTWAHAKVLRKPPPPAPRNLARMPAHVAWQDETTNPNAVAARLDVAERLLRRKRFRVVRGSDSADGTGGGWVAAEKGYLREIGNLLFHLALIGILAGFAIKGYYGYKGSVLVTEGETFANFTTNYDNKAFGGGVNSDDLPPFRITLDKFYASYDGNISDSDFGQPRGFDADVTYQPAGSSATKHAVISENDPLSVDGANVYLTSHGYAPVITVKDGKGKAVYHGAVKFIQADSMFVSTGQLAVPSGITGPDGFGTELGLSAVFLPTAPPQMVNGPQSLFPAADNPELLLTAYYGSNLNDTASVYAIDTSHAKQLTLDPKNKRTAVQLTPGQSVQLPNGMGSVSFDGVAQYAQFDINHDPSKQLVLPSAVAIVLGLLLSLGIRRRRVFVRVRPADDGVVRVEVAGLARAEDARLRDEVRGVAAALRVKQKPVTPQSAQSAESGARQ